MKYIVLIIGLTLVQALQAQSHKAGTLSIQGNFEGGFVKSNSEAEFNGTLIDKDTSSAVLASFGAGIHYSLVEFISVGVYGNYGSYSEDVENVESSTNNFINFGAAVRAYPLNKDNINWYIGGRVGYSVLRMDRVVNAFINTDFTYGGAEFIGETGVNWYFANFIGVNIGVNYQYRNFDMKEFNINGSSQDLTNFSYMLQTSGIGFTAGVSLKIN